MFSPKVWLLRVQPSMCSNALRLSSASKPAMDFYPRCPHTTVDRRSAYLRSRMMKVLNFLSYLQDSDRSDENAEDPDIAKIKKVQSFFRGWLCRRRWKQIVDEYIRSPHAESMRKRNWWVLTISDTGRIWITVWSGIQITWHCPVFRWTLFTGLNLKTGEKCIDIVLYFLFLTKTPF